jgi:cytosine/adenosine deaminase-related metal-dependent hydrolase
VIRYHARWVLPITAPPIADGTVAVEGTRIAYVGERSGAPAGEGIDLGDAVLMPGLVNAHTHLELTLMRGFLEDLAFPAWISRLTAARKDACTRDMLLDAARLGVAEGILAGVTTYADTCDSGVAFDAMLEAGVRGVMFQEVFGPDPAHAAESLAGLSEKIERLLPLQTPTVRVGISPHAPYSVSDELFRATARYALETGLGMAIHIAESEPEHALVVAGTGPFADFLRGRAIPVAPRGRSSIELLHRLGVLHTRPLLIHCVRIDAGDIEAIATSHASVVHCPASNAKLGHGVAPLTDLVAANIDLGLGSDSMASNNRMDILGEARLAVMQQRAHVRRHDALSAPEALRVATLGGARALGLGDVIGSLEPGKQADLAAFSLARHIRPTYRPEAAAVFALHGTQAVLTVVEGRELVREGRAVHEDAGLPARVQSSADVLAHWLSQRT